MLGLSKIVAPAALGLHHTNGRWKSIVLWVDKIDGTQCISGPFLLLQGRQPHADVSNTISWDWRSGSEQFDGFPFLNSHFEQRCLTFVGLMDQTLRMGFIKPTESRAYVPLPGHLSNADLLCNLGIRVSRLGETVLAARFISLNTAV